MNESQQTAPPSLCDDELNLRMLLSALRVGNLSIGDMAFASTVVALTIGSGRSVQLRDCDRQLVPTAMHVVTTLREM